MRSLKKWADFSNGSVSSKESEKRTIEEEGSVRSSDLERVTDD